LDQLDQALSVVDRGIDLEPVADDADVGEQPGALGLAVARHHVGIESLEGAPKRLALLEDREPRQAGLVDLEHEPLEQPRVVTQREAVFVVVIGAVEWMAGSDLAVGHWVVSRGRGTAPLLLPSIECAPSFSPPSRSRPVLIL